MNGKFLLLHTEDGKSWKELPGDKMPETLPKEGAFAVSNTSLLVTGKRNFSLGPVDGRARFSFQRQWQKPDRRGNHQ